MLLLNSPVPVLAYRFTIAITFLGFLGEICASSYLSRLEEKPSPKQMKYLFEMIRDRELKSSSSSSSEESTSSDTSSTYYKQSNRASSLPQPLPLNSPKPPLTSHFENDVGHGIKPLKTKRKPLKLFELESDLDGESMTDYEDKSKESYLRDEPSASITSDNTAGLSQQQTSPDKPHPDPTFKAHSANKPDDNGYNENDINRSPLPMGENVLKSKSRVVESGSESGQAESAAGKELLLLSSKAGSSGDGSDSLTSGGSSVSDASVGESIGREKEEIVIRDQQEKLLLRHLLVGYEKDVRPVLNASQPVLVRVGITLTQIFDMNEKQQVLTTSVWLDQEWNDELLRWDPKDFGGLEMIRIPCERIWLPDIVLYNNADDYTRGYMPSRAMVSYDGNVFWPPPTKFRSTCSVDVTYFPFDDQTCSLKLGSWTYNGFQVDVTNRTSAVDLSNYVSNGEWELLTAVQQRNLVHYSCCPEFFPDVTITLVMRRKTLYYIYNIVLPCIMLSSLTLLVFCLPPDSGEKIALGITVLLAFSVFMLAINESLPETSESIPLIGVYLTIVMAITSVSVIMTVVVLNLHYLGPQVRPVPRWLMCLLPKEKEKSRIRQKSLLIPIAHREPKSGSLKRGHIFITQFPRGASAGGESYSIEVPEEKLEDMTMKDVSEVSAAETLRNDNSGNFSHNARRRLTPHSTGGGDSSETQQYHQRRNGGGFVKEDTPDNRDAAPGGTWNVLFEELLMSIRHLINKQEQVEAQNNLVAEWRLVAQVVDRILFWLFFTFTFSSSALILLVLPIYKRSWYDGSPLLMANGTDM